MEMTQLPQTRAGLYTTAAEQSPHKLQIDQWLNDDKSSMWISRELKIRYQESISDKSITKYRNYRKNLMQQELNKDPTYNGKMEIMQQTLVDSIGKVKEVDTMSHLADVIEQSADLLKDAHDRDIQVKNIQDMRFVSQTLLDAIKIYGDTVLKAQRYNAVQENPGLLKPTNINVNVKSALTDILKEVMNHGGTDGYALIDKLRTGVELNDNGGNDGDTGSSGSSVMDGEQKNPKGTTVLVQKP